MFSLPRCRVHYSVRHRQQPKLPKISRKSLLKTYRKTQIFSLPFTQNQAFVSIPASSPMGSLIPSNQHLAVVKCPIRTHLYRLWPIRLSSVTSLRYCLYSSLVFAIITIVHRFSWVCHVIHHVIHHVFRLCHWDCCVFAVDQSDCSRCVRVGFYVV